MDDPILEERLKKMFESRAGELPDESLMEVRIRKHGADLVVGSLIKNPGGGIAPTGAPRR